MSKQKEMSWEIISGSIIKVLRRRNEEMTDAALID